MYYEDAFRYILILGFLSVLPIAIYHRLNSYTGEHLDRSQEGFVLLVPTRIIGLLGIGTLVAYMIEPRLLENYSIELPIWLRDFGVVLGAITAALLIWTLRSLGKNLTDTVVTRKDHTLVTNGPYAIVRHPFYLSLAMAVIANSLVTANWLVFTLGASTYVLLIIRSRTEEKKLLERFGPQYQQYVEKTGKLFPRIFGPLSN